MFGHVLLIAGLAVSALASPVIREKRSEDSTANVPYLVSLELGLPEGTFVGTLYCGGVIISESWIITTGYCMGRYPNQYRYIRVGNSQRETGGVTRRIESFFVCEGYGINPRSNSMNIALIELSEPLELSDTIQPIALPDLMDEIPVGSVGTISGFGTQLRPDGPRYDDVQIVEEVVLSDEVCRQRWGAIHFNYDVICGGPVSSVEGYQGDSGVPLVIDGVLHGIQSLSLGYYGLDEPRIYSKISYFRQWIYRHTGF